MCHLQETYPYEKHFMEITNNKFYIQFPLNHAHRTRPQSLDKTQKNDTWRLNNEDTKIWQTLTRNGPNALRQTRVGLGPKTKDKMR